MMDKVEFCDFVKAKCFEKPIERACVCVCVCTVQCAMCNVRVHVQSCVHTTYAYGCKCVRNKITKYNLIACIRIQIHICIRI